MSQKRPSANFGNSEFLCNFSPGTRPFLPIERDCRRLDDSYLLLRTKNGPFYPSIHRFYTGHWAFFVSTPSNWIKNARIQLLGVYTFPSFGPKYCYTMALENVITGKC